MIAPPFLIGAALVFWGWQTGNVAVGVALGAALEGLRALRLRVALGTEEHSRIADLSTVGFVLLAAALAANRGVSHGILQAFVWVPAALAPIVCAQLLAPGRRVPLSALFRHMRKLKRADPEVQDPAVDVTAVYVALIIVSAGVANARGPGYYVAAVAATGWALWAVRPRAGSAALWVMMLALAGALGHGAHIGLAGLQARLESWVIDFSLRGIDADPYRTVTAIGAIGRLKQEDEILLRVFAAEGEAPRLLHRASYNSYSGTSWFSRDAPMRPLEPAADPTVWPLAPSAGEAPAWRLSIASRLERGKALIALPAGAARIAHFPALSLRRNALGAVHADVGAAWAQYSAEGSGSEDNPAGYAGPGALDSAIPAAERPLLERLATELGLPQANATEAVRRVERHLAGFRYSVYRDHAIPRGATALGDFLSRTRSGHCEYFAAATTLLLRAAGVPARYATGYAVNEYSRLEGAYVVRARHAHAWTRAWIGGHWVDVDTTPPDWFSVEAEEAPALQGLADLFRWAAFRWTMRGDFRADDAWLGVPAVLALLLAWRLFRGKRLTREDARERQPAPRRWPGEDSEFYLLERALPARRAGEAPTLWLRRIADALPPSERLPVREALRLHLRYRFDPAGLGPTERARLREISLRLARRTS